MGSVRTLFAAFATLALNLGATSASAGVEQQLEICRMLQPSAQRLACYDKLASRVVQPPASIAGETESLSVVLRGKNYRPADAMADRYSNQLELDLEYANDFDEEIRAFTGTMVFMDIFDREFLRVRLTVDERIPAGRTVRDRGKVFEINQFMASHQQLVTTDLDNLRMKFESASIMFSDGRTIGSPN
jgi:hypothetical protein